MSSQRTINSHNKPRKPGEPVINFYSQTTSKLDAESRRSLENAANTYANRSKETIAKQAKAHESKEKAEARAKELEKDFADLFNGDLIDRMVASFNEIGTEETLKRFKNDLKAFKLLSDEYQTLNTPTSSLRAISYYDELFYKLAKRFPKLILYISEKCFSYSVGTPLPLQELSAEELQKLQAKLEKTDLFNNNIFKKRYLKFFPTHVTEIEDINDISYALKLNPECFAKFKPTGTFRSGFYQNPQPFLTIVKASPAILNYATESEFILFAQNFGSQLGVAINKCPNILENLPTNFFNKFPAKLIFGTVNKTQLKPKLEQFYGRFPVLESYLSSAQIKPKAKREPKPTYQFVPSTDPMDF